MLQLLIHCICYQKFTMCLHCIIIALLGRIVRIVKVVTTAFLRMREVAQLGSDRSIISLVL